MQGLRQPSDAEIVAFLDQELHHEREETSQRDGLLNPTQTRLVQHFEAGKILEQQDLGSLSAGARDLLEDYRAARRAKSELDDLINGKDSELADLRQRLAQAGASADDLRRSLSQRDQDLVQAQARIADLEGEREQIRARASAQQEELREAVEQWRLAASACEQQQSLLETGTRTLAEASQTLEARRQALEEERQALAAERQDSRRALAADYDNLDRERRDLAGERRRLEESRNALAADRQGLDQAQRELAGERRLLEESRSALAADYDNLDRERRDLAGERRRLEESQSILVSDRQQLDQAQRELDDERRRLEESQGILAADRQQLDQAQRELDDERRQLEESQGILAADRQGLDQEWRDLAEEHWILDQDRRHLEEERRILAENQSALASDRHNLVQERRELAAKQDLLEETQRTLDSGRRDLEEERRVLEDQRQALDERSSALDQRSIALDGQQQRSAEQAKLLAEERRIIEGLQQAARREGELLARDREMLAAQRQGVDELGRLLETERATLAEQVRVVDEERRRIEEQRQAFAEDKAAMTAHSAALEQRIRDLGADLYAIYCSRSWRLSTAFWSVLRFFGLLRRPARRQALEDPRQRKDRVRDSAPQAPAENAPALEEGSAPLEPEREKLHQQHLELERARAELLDQQQALVDHQERLEAEHREVKTQHRLVDEQQQTLEAQRRALAGQRLALLDQQNGDRGRQDAGEAPSEVLESGNGDRGPLLEAVPGTAYDVFCFPVIDWEFRYQRPQQMMSQFALHGHRGYYLRTTFHRSGPAALVEPIRENVFGLHLPGPTELSIYKKPMADSHLEILLRVFEKLRHAEKIREAVLLVQLPFWAPLAFALKRRWGWKVIYDCMDDHGGFSNNESGMLDFENALITSSDLVVATARLLYEKVSPLARRSMLNPNAADFDHFAYSRNGNMLGDLARPIVGYFGAISEWFDVELVHHAATARPQWQFVLIGDTYGADVSPLQELSNVHLLGELPYEILPGYLDAFDVATIPFKLSPLTRATNPVKFYEYLSAAKPVVAVELPELKPYHDYYYPVRSQSDFVPQIETALAEESPERQRTRIDFARRQTWAARFHDLRGEIRQAHGKAAIIIVSYHNLEYLGLCLDSIGSKTQYPNFEVIVVDNGSGPDIENYLTEMEARLDWLRVIFNRENLGFPRANNIGIEAAEDCEYVVLLNDDVVVTPGWLGKLVHYLDKPDIELVGPTTNWAGNEARIEVGYDDLQGMEEFAERHMRQHDGEHFDIGVLAMYCVAMRRSLLDRIGLLDERFGIGMFEDDDFSRRVREAGGRVVCAEDLFIHHWGRSSFAAMDEAVYKQLFEDNRRQFEAKWNQPWVPHRYREGANFDA